MVEHTEHSSHQAIPSNPFFRSAGMQLMGMFFKEAKEAVESIMDDE